MATSSLQKHGGLLLRAFPPPAYLTMPAAGIDMSDYSIKHVLLKRKGSRVVLASYGKVDLPLGTIEQGEIKDHETLVKLLSRVRKEHGYEHIQLSLPEEHAYLFQTTIPEGSSAEMEHQLEFHLKENVPFGANEAVFDYNVISTSTEGKKLNVSVYPVTIASDYVEAVEEAGFKPLSVEVEGQATARALLRPNQTAPTLIIDLGRNQAGLSISVGGMVTFTANLETGGDVLTRAIARGMDVSFQEAERLKREYGFTNTKESELVYKVLKPAVSDIMESINKHLAYWRMHARAAGDKASEVSRVILVGGNANLEGLTEYLETGLGVEVVVGNVWENVFVFDEYIPAINANQSLEFATAVGLALRSLMRSSS